MAVLDWISPLRPDCTDIAEYTVRAAQALNPQYQLNPISNSNAGDLGTYKAANAPIFNIGNDVRFHGNILGACREMSGIVIAHDFRIQDLIVSHLQKYPDWEGRYSRLMSRHYGKAGLASAREFLDGKSTLTDLSEEFPGIEIATDAALCLVTHNPLLVEELAERTGLTCHWLPLPFPSHDELPPRRRLSRDGLDLLVFGYLGHNRGLDHVCDLMRENRADLHLHIAGQVGPALLRAELDKLIAAGCMVTDHGFLDEASLDRLVRDCDLVLNLRDPSMGEVSGSQLRTFAQSGLSVVCNTGWYSSLPDNAVLKVNPGRIKQELCAIVNRLLADRHAFEDTRWEGRRFLESVHSFDRFAKTFERFYSNLPHAFIHGRRVLLAEHIAGLYDRHGAGQAVSSETVLRKATDLLRVPEQ